MRLIQILSILLLLINFEVKSQTTIVTGKVVTEDFEVLNGAVIQTKDSVVLGRANEQGIFEIQLPNHVHELQIWFVGMESETLKLSGRCKHLNVILLNDIVVEFETVKEARKRFKIRRRQLPELYHKAFEMAIFEDEKPCI